jgi:hypothetical protein
VSHAHPIIGFRLGQRKAAMRANRWAEMRPVVVVLGCDDVGSAVARELHVAGAAVVLIDDIDPPWARRGMAYVDAWYVGGATLEGVDACFCASVRSLPAVFARGDMIAATAWSWQGVATALRPVALVETRCGASTDAFAGFDGAVTAAPRRPAASPVPHVSAARPGRFSTGFEIAERVAAGELVGELDREPIYAPATGALRALPARGARLSIGQAVLEIETSGESHRCFGIEPGARAIARRVAAGVRQSAPIAPRPAERSTVAA